VGRSSIREEPPVLSHGLIFVVSYLKWLPGCLFVVLYVLWSIVCSAKAYPVRQVR
jgi:hypothetical protein